MVIFLTGKDSYRKHRRAAALRMGFLKKYDSAGTQAESIVCGEADMSDIRRSLGSGGLFQEKRFLVIWSLSALKKDGRTELFDYVKKKDADTVVVLVDDGLHASTARSVKKWADKTEEFGELKPYEMEKLAGDIGGKLRVQVNPDAARLLAEHAGTDGWAMETSITRLTSLAKGRGLAAIGMDLVTETLPRSAEDNIFLLTDALSARNWHAVIKQLDNQRRAGTHELVILAMLSKHLKTLLTVKETGGDGLKIHPFVLKKAQGAVGGFASEDLKALYSRVLEAEKALKMSPPDAWSTLLQAIFPINSKV